MGIFNFNKNNSQNASTPQQGQSSGSSSGQVSSGPQTVQSTGTQSYNGIGAPPSGQSYNGIGAPPSGQSYNGIGTPPSGQSYNGIGSPPSGQSYNGIGNPPAQSAPQSQTPPPQQQPNQQQADYATGKDVNKPQQTQTDKTQQQAGATPAQDGNEQKQDQPNQQNAQGDQKKPDDQNKEASGDKNQGQGEQGATTPPPQGDITKLMTRLTQRSNKVIAVANAKAKSLNSDIDSEHLLAGLLSDSSVYRILSEVKVPPTALEQELNKIYKKGYVKENPQLSPRAKQIVQNAMNVARKAGYEFISPEHLLLAVYEEGQGMGAQLLKRMGLKKEDLEKKVTGGKNAGAEGKANEKKQKTMIEQFTIDLTAKAAAGQLDKVIGRHEETERVIHVLSRRMKNNPCLVGEPGVGKTAIVEGLAQRIVRKEVPDTLVGKRIVTLEINSMIAGASHRGEFEERIKKLVDELKEAKGDAILFIDEIHTIVGAGGEGAGDAANFLKPAMARGEIQLIGATTIAEFTRYIEKDPALERRFQKVKVPEPSPEETIKMLQGVKDRFESYHRVKIPDEAIEQCVTLSQRYVGDRYLPDKAFDLMDEAAAAVKLPLLALPQQIKAMGERITKLKQESEEEKKRGEHVKARIDNSKIKDLEKDLQDKKMEYDTKKAQTTTSVTEAVIKDIISQKTGIPISRMASSEKEKMAHLEDIMHERMIGQERAVTAVAEAVRRGRSGLKAKGRPVGGFIFLGPSGTGKTELAKTLAEVMFGQEEAMIRFDMTEYMEKHEVAKLLGPPPGYVGYEEGGKLTNAVRQRPYCVVLFDEVEKAHPDIFNILLQILDDGRLTDNKGRVVSFKDVVVICTSNLGSKLIQKELLGAGAQVGAGTEAAVDGYALTPDGREVLMIGKTIYEKQGNGAAGITQLQTKNGSKPEETDPSKWQKGSLEEYFSQQTIKPDSKNSDVQFPKNGYDTHVIAPDGQEMLTKDAYLFTRSSQNETAWGVHTLKEYFEGSKVGNADANAMNEQLPKKRIRTHAFTPEGIEVITLGERMWRRKAPQSNEWETLQLKEYVKDQQVAQGTFPTSSWDAHVFLPDGEEMVSTGDAVWYKSVKDNIWRQEKMSEYFGKEFPLRKGQLPSTYTLSPAGKEILTTRNAYYSRGGGDEQPAEQPQTAPQQQPQNSPKLDKTQGENSWGENTLEGFFANQTVVPKDEKQKGELQLPTQGFDTYAVKPNGEEVISKDNILFFRPNTMEQQWKAETLASYFHENKVINAQPGEMEHELPTVLLNTHAFAPDGQEIITFRDRFWRKTGDTNEWQVGFLKDYFVDQTVDTGDFPIDAWNVHTFLPDGRELIISGNSTFTRQQNAPNWTREKIDEFFGGKLPGEGDDKEQGVTLSNDKYLKIKDAVMGEVLKFFRPELVNRFDAAIVFEPLQLHHVKKIARLNLKSLNKLVMEQEMTISFTDSAVRQIAIEGYDPLFGARPLRRSIQKLVENPLSELIIAEKVKAGDMITVDFDGKDFHFDTKQDTGEYDEKEKTTSTSQAEPKNFTPLDIEQFIEKFFAKDKDALMKKVEEIKTKSQSTNGNGVKKENGFHTSSNGAQKSQAQNFQTTPSMDMSTQGGAQMAAA